MDRLFEKITKEDIVITIGGMPWEMIKESPETWNEDSANETKTIKNEIGVVPRIVADQHVKNFYEKDGYLWDPHSIPDMRPPYTSFFMETSPPVFEFTGTDIKEFSQDIALWGTLFQYQREYGGWKIRTKMYVQVDNAVNKYPISLDFYIEDGMFTDRVDQKIAGFIPKRFVIPLDPWLEALVNDSISKMIPFFVAIYHLNSGVLETVDCGDHLELRKKE